MNHDDAIRAIKAVADQPDDIIEDGQSIFFSRYGHDYVLETTYYAEHGLCARVGGDSDTAYRPFASVIQQDILNLPILAQQVDKHFTRIFSKLRDETSIGFIDGPAHWTDVDGNRKETPESLQFLVDSLDVKERPWSTRIIHLTAPAGFGKTILLNQAARTAANRYQPDPSPHPIIFPVDLLGRYIGTIDDAIAGSLNNTYRFPQLSQKDIAECVRRGWIILALDGFDELVARIGGRNAFGRLTELVDELAGDGNLILSARKSFFQLYQTVAATKSYLVPSEGGFYTEELELQEWGITQLREVCNAAGIESPDIAERIADQYPQEIWSQPFFATRIVGLSDSSESDGEEIAGSGSATVLLERLIEREAREKWTSREGSPLLRKEQHISLLAAIAEEIWITQARGLDSEELGVIFEIWSEGQEVTPDVGEQVEKRITVHACFDSDGRRIAFAHENFFDYALAWRLSEALEKGEGEELEPLLSAGELPSLSIHIGAKGCHTNSINDVVQNLCAVAKSTGELAVAVNAGYLIAEMIAQHGGRHVYNTSINNVCFHGESLRGLEIDKVALIDCTLYSCDLSGTSITRSICDRCNLSEVLFDDSTDLSQTVFNACDISGIVGIEGKPYYDPKSIAELINRHGGVTEKWLEQALKEFHVRASFEVYNGVAEVCRWCRRATDFTLDRLEEELGELGESIYRAGTESHVLKPVNKPSSGPRKVFLRWKVGQKQLLSGFTTNARDERIRKFWNLLGAEYPAPEIKLKIERKN